MTEAEKAYQYFVIAVPENEEQAKAYFWARKALQSTLTQPNEPLTLDELGEMSYTDWVWLEFPREKPSDNCWERGWKAYRLYSHERYGVSWIAYRRPPEGEEEENDVIEITENL